MFTGLVEQVGRCEGLRRDGSGWTLTVGHHPWEHPLEAGESVAVQGACLTVRAHSPASFTCDVLDETVSRTNFSRMRHGTLLNLERSLPANGRFGGHFVSAHVDGTGRAVAVDRVGRDWRIRCACAPDLVDGIVVKGSVTCDGVSLTVADMQHNGFDVHVIPFTWEQTSLQRLRPGDLVNIETDLLGKYVQRFMQGGVRDTDKPDLPDRLRQAGFM